MKLKPILDKMPILGKLFGALRFGFRVLGWPLQIILSVIDFIRGFVAEERNLADKITAGVKSAVFGFIELPVKLIGWIIEKILGLFGVEVDRVADKIMGFIGKFFDMWIGMFRPIIGFFEGLFKTKGSIIDKLKGAIGGFLNGIIALFDKIKPVLKFFGIDVTEDEEAKPEPPKPKSTISTVATAEAKKEAEKQQEQTDQLKNALEANTQKQIDAQKELAKEKEDSVAIAMGGKGGDSGTRTSEQQIPDETDNWGMIILNQMGSF
jgi:hypothetical protein